MYTYIYVYIYMYIYIYIYVPICVCIYIYNSAQHHLISAEHLMMGKHLEVPDFTGKISSRSLGYHLVMIQ